tara:strand:- start:106 stop:456 length:351 start_codon:yes stop_codon:yes gene_type:complete
MVRTEEQKKQRIIDYKKEYYKNNKEKIKERKKEYNNTEQGKKSHCIGNWKTIGVKNNDFSSLYDYYLNCKICEECGKEDITGNNKHLDHNHKTGEFRNILCNSCNQKRGFIDRKLK